MSYFMNFNKNGISFQKDRGKQNKNIDKKKYKNINKMKKISRKINQKKHK